MIESENKKIFVVDMKNENKKILSEIAEKWLKKYLWKWEKIWIIMSKKWYSSGIICQDCWEIPKCKNCDVPIAFHIDGKWDYFWLCHICKTSYEFVWECNNCKWSNMNLYWTWTQKIKEYIKNTYWVNALIIESETANSIKKVDKLLNEINIFDIIIWTSLISLPINNINFKLLIIQNADIWLNIPDFNASYNNFIFLYETINFQNYENIILQTLNPDNYTIRNAVKQDFNWFLEEELQYRKEFSYPPFSEMCVILYKNELEERLFSNVNRLYQELLYIKEQNKNKYWEIEIFATPPLVYKIFWKFRYNIIVKWKDIREFMDYAYTKLKIQNRWFKVDWLPNNITW